MTVRGIGVFMGNNEAWDDKNVTLINYVQEALEKRSTGIVCIYIRKSDPAGRKVRANYLIEQEQIAPRLIEAGICSDKIRVFAEDIGKKGNWSRKFREDLDRLFDLVGEGQVACVISLDVARLFRDIWNMEPAHFAARMARCHTPLITTHNREWHLLQLRKKKDADTFAEWAKQAAEERLTIRGRTITAKEGAVIRGNYVGGPTPLGWAANAGVSQYETEDGNRQSPQISVYAPHAEYRLRVKAISLLPTIATVTALRRYLIQNNILCPPFDPETSREAFGRSALSRMRKHVKTGNTKYIERLAEKPFVPSTKTLWDILLNPWDIGIRLYGSGKSGKYLLKKHEKMAEEMDQPCDSMIRAGKVYVNEFPNLAICKTDDERKLFFDVWRKWGRTDIDALIASKWEEEKPNPHQEAGKPVITRSDYKPSNPWARRVYCLHHQDIVGDVAYTHRMAIHHHGTAWLCYRDYQQGEGDICSTWAGITADGKSILTHILNTHFTRSIRHALDNDERFIRPLVEEEQERRRYMAKLEAEISELHDVLKSHTDAFASLAIGMANIDEETRKSILDDYTKNHIVPLSLQKDAKRAELTRVKAKMRQSADETLPSERRVRDMLHKLGDNWNALPVEDRMYIVDALVARIGVNVGDGTTIREGVITFTWKNGTTERLVSWRSRSNDIRPFTVDEDNAIRHLWPASSGATWQAIKASVLPNRKFRAVRKRARELGIAKGAKRSMAWIAECNKEEQEWDDNNPEVLYLQVSNTVEGDCIMVYDDGRAVAKPIRIPDAVLRNLHVLNSKTCCAAGLRGR